MGKRLIIKGADFSQVAVSKEDKLNPLSVEFVGIGGGYLTSYLPRLSNGDYCILTNSQNFFQLIGGALTQVSFPSEYGSVELGGVTMKQVDGVWEPVYLSNGEVLEWTENQAYRYNAEQASEPAQTAIGGFRCAKAQLNKGDVVVWSGTSGSGPRAIWVMNQDNSETLIVTQESTATTYSPVCYVAESNCNVYLNCATVDDQSKIRIFRAS